MVKNIAIVLNPLAGSGRGIVLAEKILASLKIQSIPFQLFSSRWPTDFNGFSEIWIVGGDGTMNYFINSYPTIQLPLVLFPGGSGNDFNWMLYGNKNFEQILETALTAIPKKVDAGKCNEHLFLNSCGTGFDGSVAKSLTGKSKKKGKTSFYKQVIKKIFTYAEIQYEFTSDLKLIKGKFLTISIMNGMRAGGGFYIAPMASIQDGLFEVTFIKPLSILKRLFFLPIIEKGKHKGASFIEHFQSKKLKITSDQPMDIQLDGEYYSSKQMNIELLPGKFLFKF